MANEMRDKIAEIIRNAHINANPLAQFGYAEADALIENGVIVPPCKVGDTIYTISINREIEEYVVAGVVEYPEGWFVSVYYGGFGYTLPIDKVFFTKEAAEQKLKEMRGVE